MPVTTPTAHPHPSDLLDRQITERLQAPDYQRWRAQVQATGGCARPIRLVGSSTVLDRRGQVLHSHAGDLLAPCGNRRASVCEACSARYAADAFHLLRAGLSGGHKDIPTTITTKPRAFLTLTAPSFGPVHTRRVTQRGRVIPCGCGDRHHPEDSRIGGPLDPESYDYQGAVLWQAHTGPLWHRFTVALRRALAHRLGIPGRHFPQMARLSYAKVAEYQRRGLVHFHAAIRLDGPDGPADATPAMLTSAVLREAITEAAGAVTLTIERPNSEPLELVWGAQFDIRDITATAADQIEDKHGQITEARLAGYIAKYATKGTGKSEAADRPIPSEEHIEHLHLAPHHERLIRTVWELGGDPRYDDLNLRKWAHMLGFRGHFLTKSQQYSTTFGAIRKERHVYQLAHTLTQLGHDTDDLREATVINHWQLTGIGHHNDAEKELAEAIGERARHPAGERTRREEY
jgi:hypothetical protein